MHTGFHREDKWRFARTLRRRRETPGAQRQSECLGATPCALCETLCRTVFLCRGMHKEETNAAQRRPHPDHPYRQPAAPGGADAALCPARRAARRSIAAELDRRRQGGACARSCAKQIEAGIDVGNNGEQQREAFFLYVRHRMSGFGGGWTRGRAPMSTRYPAFRRMEGERMTRCNESVSNRGGVPEAIGEVRYLDRARDRGRMRRFPRRARRERAAAFVEPFMTAPSPGIIAAAMRNALRHRGRLSRRARPRAAGRIRGHRQARLPAAARLRRTSRWSGTSPIRTGRSAISSASSSAWSRRSTTRSSTCRATACGCMSAGATTRARTTATWRCTRSCRPCSRPRSAASCCRSPIRAMRTNTAA